MIAGSRPGLAATVSALISDPEAVFFFCCSRATSEWSLTWIGGVAPHEEQRGRWSLPEHRYAHLSQPNAVERPLAC